MHHQTELDPWRWRVFCIAVYLYATEPVFATTKFSCDSSVYIRQSFLQWEFETDRVSGMIFFEVHHLSIAGFKPVYDPWTALKLYCRYLYTRPCMINHIWGLKQLWLQVNGHAWFHLQRLRWPVRNGEGAKNSKWKYMSPAGFEPTPRQSTTGKLQRLRPLGHEGLMVISG